MHDRRPALIARCRRPATSRLRSHTAGGAGIPIAVRGGGHSMPGHSACDGGIVIDLRGRERA